MRKRSASAAARIAITPYYTKGSPVDVIYSAIERAEAVAETLESYRFEGNDDQHLVPIEPETMSMLITMICDHLRIAKEAAGHLQVKGA